MYWICTVSIRLFSNVLYCTICCHYLWWRSGLHVFMYCKQYNMAQCRSSPDYWDCLFWDQTEVINLLILGWHYQDDHERRSKKCILCLWCMMYTDLLNVTSYEYLKVGIDSSKWVNYTLCVTLDQSDWSKNENCGLDIINHNNLLKLIEDSFYICNVFRKENPQTSLYLVQNIKCFLVFIQSKSKWKQLVL